MRHLVLYILLLVVVCVMFCYAIVNRPIITGEITKQTVYLSMLNYFHKQDNRAGAQFILIDDDGGDGIFYIHDICERIGVKAIFAVVTAWLDSTRCDSLRKWCSEGYGIALHGYEHGRWKDWTEREIVSDINHSLEFLGKNGFDINEIKIVVTPGFYNTRAIRSAVASKKMKMVMGANVVNPDTETFQWGRFFINRGTDTVDAREILLKAKQKKGFVVFGTHSSIQDEFSSEKTEEILKMALQIGLKFKRE